MTKKHRLPTLTGLLRGAVRLGLLGAAALLAVSFLNGAGLGRFSHFADSVALLRPPLAALLAVAAAADLALSLSLSLARSPDPAHGRRRGSARPGLAGLSLAALTVLAGLGPANGLGLFERDLAASTDRPAAAPGAEITLMQLNLNYRNRSHGAVAALVRRWAPDAIALQEVSRAAAPLLAALRADYPYQIVCPFSFVGGVAVLSKWPPTGPDSHACTARSGAVWLQVAGPTGPVTLVSAHLYWPFPWGQNAQVDQLVPLLEAAPRPILMGADLNAAPWSRTTARLAAAAGAPVSPGYRITISVALRRVFRGWPGPNVALGLPIDHLLADPAFAFRGAVVGPRVGSDHLPLLARYAAPAGAKP